MGESITNVRRQNRPWQKVRRILLFVMAVLLSLAVIEAIRVTVVASRVANDAQTLQRMVEQDVSALLQPERAGEVEEMLSQSAQDWHELRSTIGPLANIAPFFAWLPNYGGDLASGPALFDLADQLVACGQETWNIARPIIAAPEAQRPSSVSVGAMLLRVSQDQAPAIERTRQRFVEALQTRSRIDAARLSPSLHSLLTRLDRGLPLWKAALDGMALAPQALGEDRPRVYLLLAQNSDELRATGGFISAVAELRVEQGELSVVDFRDSYAVDDRSKLHPTPPEPLRKYMNAGQWLLRDANWSPDFPTSARTIENIYRIDRGVTVDGVIAIDLQAISSLLEAVGPITVGDERVDATNVLEKLQEAWAEGQGQNGNSVWWLHRKDFGGKLLQAVVARLHAGELDRTQLARAVYQMITAKDLLIYLNQVSPEEQANLPWSGALDKTSANALMIVDSNVGFNKMSRRVDRRAEYAVSIEPSGQVQASVTITYTNLTPATTTQCILQAYYPRTYDELQQGCYWDYVRVVAPAGSQLLRGAGLADATTEPSLEGRSIFSGYFVLPRGESETVRFEYRLPQAKDVSRYRVNLEKQPGALPIPVRLKIALPQGWRASSAMPPVQSSRNMLEFAVLLDRNQEIDIHLKRDTSNN